MLTLQFSIHRICPVTLHRRVADEQTDERVADDMIIGDRAVCKHVAKSVRGHATMQIQLWLMCNYSM